MALVPLAFAVAAFGTRKPDWPVATLKGMGLAILIGLPISVLLRDPLSGLIAAYAAGAVVTVRSESLAGSGRRWLAALGVTVVMLVLVRVALPLAVTVGPALPFSAVLLSDPD